MNLFSSLDLALCLLSAYVGLYHLVLFLNRRSTKESLHFSFLCFAIAINDAAGVGLYQSASIPTGQFWQKGQFFCSVAISMGFVIFTYSLLKRKRDLPKAILLALLGILFALGVALGSYILDPARPMAREMVALGSRVTYFEHQPGLLWNLLFVLQLVGMCWLYGLLIREYVRNKKRDLLPLLFGFFVFFVSAIVDMLISMDALRFVYTIEYAFLGMILVMDYILIKRFIGLFAEVENLNLHLGEKVAERTAEIQRLANERLALNRQLEAKNASLTTLVERDGMTHLLNHTAFHRRLGEMLNFCGRQRLPLSVMLLDIDHFKGINDKHGHPAGDHVIVEFAKVLRDCSRDYDLKGRLHDEEDPHPSSPPAPSDMAGRYGGDEFAVAFPCCGIAEATIIGERLCAGVRELVFPAHPDLRVTASIGCAVLLDPAVCRDELELIQQADQALYCAKANGRNQMAIQTLPSSKAEGASRPR